MREQNVIIQDISFLISVGKFKYLVSDRKCMDSGRKSLRISDDQIASGRIGPCRACNLFRLQPSQPERTARDRKFDLLEGIRNVNCYLLFYIKRMILADRCILLKAGYFIRYKRRDIGMRYIFSGSASEMHLRTCIFTDQ